MIAVALVAVGAVGVCVHLVDSRRQPVLVAGALAPYLMAVAAPGALAFGLSGQWIGTAAGVLVLAAAAATQWPLYRARMRPRRVRAGRDLVLMQANILVGGADPRALVAQVDRLGVDVLTVCELTPEGLDRLLEAGLSQRLRHSYHCTGDEGEGTGIWSRHPLSETTRHDGYVCEHLSARVELPDGPSPLLFAVHPVPPWPRPQRDWLRELESLRQLLAKVPADAGPVLVAGDFNATFDHKRYRRLLSEGYRDAAVSVGAGALATYAADRWYPPIIAIDHILVRDAEVREVHTVELPGSDHRGIWARVTI